MRPAEGMRDVAAVAAVLGITLAFLVAGTALARRDVGAPSSASIEIGFRAPARDQAASSVVCDGPEVHVRAPLASGDSLALRELDNGSYTCKIVIEPR